MNKTIFHGASLIALTVIASLVPGGGSLAATAQPGEVQVKIEDGLAWRDVREWGIEGKGWDETQHYFDRLPAKAEGLVRGAVWSLSQNSSGMLVRFKTDASAIHVRYALRSETLALPHMPATGVSGLDLYALTPEGPWRWLAVVKPTTAPEVKTKLIGGLAPGSRAYTLYLPLYNGVASLDIGLDPDADFAPIAPRAQKPIVFYGTSITQGACASRPGMAYVSIVGRRLDRPVINLGFSGNGTMDKEVAELLAELDPAVYVIDCLPNMRGDLVAERTEPLVRLLRRARPETPIVLVEDRTYANTPFIPERRERQRASRAALRAAYERLTASGIRGLHYVKGETLLGADREDTTDGSHPNDLGMMRMADVFESVLRPLITSD